MDAITAISLASNIFSFIWDKWRKFESELLAQNVKRRAAKFAIPPAPDKSTPPQNDQNPPSFEPAMSRDCSSDSTGCQRSDEIRDLRIHLGDLLRQLSQQGTKVDIDAIMAQLAIGSEKGARFSAEQAILSCLCFDTMDYRYITVTKAHEGIFTWIHEPASFSASPGSGSFFECLESPGAVYWVSGKLGSGKSTLMKCLCELPAVWERLMHWVPATCQKGEQLQLVFASFFFWNVGLEVAELVQAIQNIFDHTKTQPTIKLCFFIDGLDGSASSRPWNEFEKAFGGNVLQQLWVQDLTRDDIKLFVRDTLEKDRNFQELKEDDESCIDLIQEISNRANGVFLWVRLIVNSLLQGVTNADSVVDLRRRLDTFPTDLYEVFERELFSVDPFYRQRTARFFQVTLTSLELLPLVCYWFVD
ncbi:hypothetical protein B0T26DRAFT_674990 [Lasiosphaeria miniovina]|uniref:NACHT domain-containing protein n=1 Tax=Lasiosphaeria miniovina TaxID=1954250 RepID=A0AA40AWT2_9PEZI|nr:uncharacterized protein B0T26DRAFT_674990 [Lasiosphaeria miniovina]KAK0723417.1 hypothetical protein B0T26DRAFT_674990 [Lasiosphaeria miniovina]